MCFHWSRSEEHTSELQSPCNLVCRLLLEKKNHSRSRGLREHRAADAPSRALCAGARCTNPPASPSNTQRCAQEPRITPLLFFFFNDTATTEIYTLSLHDALPIYISRAIPAEQITAFFRDWSERR